jgi:hypothetical protein
MSSHLYPHILHDGSVITLEEALDSRGITDENGNVIHFNASDFPHFHIECNGYSYSLEDVLKTPLTLRIQKIPVQQQQQVEESQTKQQSERASTIKSKSKEK